MISRRNLLSGLLLAQPAFSTLGGAAADGDENLRQEIADLERRNGGRLGVAVLDTARNKLTAHRGDERFPLCSTHKFLSAALVLARVDRNEESLNRRVVYTRDAVVAYSPITEKHLGDGLTVGELCDAAMTVSDNTAANLLLDSFGGPPAVTAYARGLGDTVTRLDRPEPALNQVGPGDQRDTTSPLAMLENLRQTVLGTALSPASRAQMIAWLVANKTGAKRLRAGAPDGWRIGDKTGSGASGETNDIAVFWPPDRAPVIVTAYYAEAPGSEDERNAVLAAVGRLASA